MTIQGRSTNQWKMKSEGSTSVHLVANCKMTRVTVVGSRAASESFLLKRNPLNRPALKSGKRKGHRDPRRLITVPQTERLSVQRLTGGSPPDPLL